MIQVGIVGGSGYVAGELLRILLHHPEVEVNFVYSHSQPGTPISVVHQDLFEHDQVRFSTNISPEVDVLFLCLGHGQSTGFLRTHGISAHSRIIDLSRDFRLGKHSDFGEKAFIYGLPELNHTTISKAQCIANPGCFATAIQLALLPLAAHNLLQSDVHINATTGATGAGKSLSETTHFSWRDNNISIYKPFSHQHLDEIIESIHQAQPDFSHNIHFIPQRGNFSRGILASAYTYTDLNERELINLYKDYYDRSPFIKVLTKTLHLKQVVNTNYGLLQIQQIEGKVLITTVIDNLLKGAAGQAVQNMNIILGLAETTGLQFKANYF